MDVNIDPKSPHTLKILLVGGLHLGCLKDEPDRSNEAFVVFEEALEYAKTMQVDFILSSGNMFANNQPGYDVIEKTASIIKRYCLGEKRPSFNIGNEERAREFEAVPGVGPDVQIFLPNLNFNDPNIQVSMPIFTIHGDCDKADEDDVSPLDLLHSAGLINYFGKWDTRDLVRVAPLFIYKHRTALSLYGIGHLDDKMYQKKIQKKKMLFHTINQQTAFQMMVAHQDRRRGANRKPVSGMIPSFVDLVVYGKEPGNSMEPVPLNEKTYATQPGNALILHMTEEEVPLKGVGMLYINGKNFNIDPFVFRNARYFLFDTLTLDPLANLQEIHASIQENVELKVGEALEDYMRLAPHKPMFHLIIQAHDPTLEFNLSKLIETYGQYFGNPSSMFEKRIINAHGVPVKLPDSSDEEDDTPVQPYMGSGAMAMANTEDKKNVVLVESFVSGTSDADVIVIEDSDDEISIKCEKFSDDELKWDPDALPNAWSTAFPPDQASEDTPRDFYDEISSDECDQKD